jgi:hypothetical protein
MNKKKLLTLSKFFILIFTITKIYNMEVEKERQENQEDIYNALPILSDEIQIGYLQLLDTTELNNINTYFKNDKKESDKEPIPGLLSSIETWIYFEKIKKNNDVEQLSMRPAKKLENLENIDIKKLLVYIDNLPTIIEKVLFLSKWNWTSELIKALSTNTHDTDLIKFIQYLQNLKIDKEECEEPYEILTNNDFVENIKEQYRSNSAIKEEEKEEEDAIEDKIAKGTLTHKNPYINSYIISKKLADKQKASQYQLQIDYFQTQLNELQTLKENLQNIYWAEYIDWKKESIKNNETSAIKEVAVSIYNFSSKIIKELVSDTTANEKFGDTLWKIFQGELQTQKEQETEETQLIELSNNFEVLENSLFEKFTELSETEKIADFDNYKKEFKKKFDKELLSYKNNNEELCQQYKNLKETKINNQEEKIEQKKNIAEIQKTFKTDNLFVNWKQLEAMDFVNKLIYNNNQNLALTSTAQESINLFIDTIVDPTTFAQCTLKNIVHSLFLDKELNNLKWDQEKRNKAWKYLTAHLKILNNLETAIDKLIKYILNNKIKCNNLNNLLFSQFKKLLELYKTDKKNLYTFNNIKKKFLENYNMLEEKEILTFFSILNNEEKKSEGDEENQEKNNILKYALLLPHLLQFPSIIENHFPLENITQDFKVLTKKHNVSDVDQTEAIKNIIYYSFIKHQHDDIMKSYSTYDENIQELINTEFQKYVKDIFEKINSKIKTQTRAVLTNS